MIDNRERREKQDGKETQGSTCKVSRKVKDGMFRALFKEDREGLLKLYNALSGTDYTDAFMGQKDAADVELRVQVYNINYGHNRELMEKCPTLEAYAKFTAVGRKYIAEGMGRQEAYSQAVEYCIEHDILKEFLQKNKSEVVGMLLEEFDAEKYERTIREEGRLESKIDDILGLLGELGQVPQRIVELINSQDSIDVLSRWLKSAAKAETIAEFEANM